jgi:hypothetical protein
MSENFTRTTDEEDRRIGDMLRKIRPIEIAPRFKAGCFVLHDCLGRHHHGTTSKEHLTAKVFERKLICKSASTRPVTISSYSVRNAAVRRTKDPLADGRNL